MTSDTRNGIDRNQQIPTTPVNLRSVPPDPIREVETAVSLSPGLLSALPPAA